MRFYFLVEGGHNTEYFVSMIFLIGGLAGCDRNADAGSLHDVPTAIDQTADGNVGSTKVTRRCRLFFTVAQPILSGTKRFRGFLLSGRFRLGIIAPQSCQVYRNLCACI